ncbi:hypothetical protein T492DRAFT_935826 [Pavlovales sp. CCMP2436]|nr:hypothetical protein T492DRAFT_935826 [Pavlovales sp. CCMP2436]
MEEKGLRKALTYHNFNDNAINFKQAAIDIFKMAGIDTDVLRIDGKMTSSERDDKLEKLKTGIRDKFKALAAIGDLIGLRTQRALHADLDLEEPMFAACRGGHIECVKYLIDEGASCLSTPNNKTTCPLYASILINNLECIEAVLGCWTHEHTARLAYDPVHLTLRASRCDSALPVFACIALKFGASFMVLRDAVNFDKVEKVSILLRTNRDILSDWSISPDASVLEFEKKRPYTPSSSIFGNCKSVAMMKTLMMYGVSTLNFSSFRFMGDAENEWMLERKGYSSELHNFDLIGEARVRLLLRGGADLYAKSHTGSATPYSLALALLATEPTHPAARLIVDAAQPWSAATHSLFPNLVRAYVRSLRRLWVQMAFSDKLMGAEIAFSDLWVEFVAQMRVGRELPHRLTLYPLLVGCRVDIITRRDVSASVVSIIGDWESVVVQIAGGEKEKLPLTEVNIDVYPKLCYARIDTAVDPTRAFDPSTRTLRMGCWYGELNKWMGKHEKRMCRFSHPSEGMTIICGDNAI